MNTIMILTRYKLGIRYLSAAVCLLLLLCSPAPASVPRHPQEAPGETPQEMPAAAAQMNGDMHEGQAPGDAHDMAKMPHGEHAAGADAQEHVHPATSTADQAQVGLDEKLGEHIPLDLTFRDEEGKTISLAELVTGPTIIAPVYYRCPNVCHFLQGELARVLPLLKQTGGEDYRVISFSFDETETPELARRSRDTYYAATGDDYPKNAWRFLTGDRDNILKLTDAIGYHFKRVNQEFLHPVAFFVVSADGKIIRYLYGTRIVPKDLSLALFEAKSGRVGTTIRKVVQYCFSFDPKQKTYVFNILRVSATAILTTLALFAAYLVFGGRKSNKDKKP